MGREVHRLLTVIWWPSARSISLVAAQDWGVRQLAFEIEDAKEAAYHLIQFKGPVPLLVEIDRQLKIADPVVRFRIIKNKNNQPAPVAPGEPVAGTADRSDRER